MEKRKRRRVIKYLITGLVITGLGTGTFLAMKKIADVSVRKVNYEYYKGIIDNMSFNSYEDYDDNGDVEDYLKKCIINTISYKNDKYTIYICDYDENGRLKLIADSGSILSSGVIDNMGSPYFCLNSWLTHKEREELVNKYGDRLNTLSYKEIYGVRAMDSDGSTYVQDIDRIELWDEDNNAYILDHGSIDDEESLFYTDRNAFTSLEGPYGRIFLAFNGKQSHYDIFEDNVLMNDDTTDFSEYSGDAYIINSDIGIIYHRKDKSGMDYASYKAYLVADEDLCDEDEIFPAFGKIRKGSVALFILILLSAEAVIIRNDIRKDRFERAKDSFTRGVAHDMKTPLAIINNLCECYLEGVSTDKNDYYVEEIHKETGKMNEEIMSFLEYNKLSQTDKVEKERFSFSELVREQVERYRPLMQSRKVAVDIKDAVFINANREHMSLAVSNYISNAIKYSKKDGFITINLDENIFSVENTCEDSSFVKDKSIWNIMTVRDEARDRSRGSSGMGLPITAEICRINNIKYGVMDRGTGVFFYIKFK